MKKILVMILLFILLYGCSSEEPFNINGEKVPVLFSTAHVDSIITKGTAIGINEKVGISVYTVLNNIESAIPFISKEYGVSDNLGNLTPSASGQMYLFSTQLYSFYAYSPTTTVTGKQVSINNGVDFKCSTVVKVKPPTDGTKIAIPTLNNMCSRIGLDIRRDTKSTLTALNIAPVGVTIANITKQPGLYTFGNQSIDANVNVNDTYSIPNTKFNTVNDRTRYTTDFYLLPKIKGNLILTFNLFFNGDLATPKVATATIADMIFLPNSYYKYSLVIGDGIAKLYIENWDMSSSDYILGQGAGSIFIGSWEIKTDVTDIGASTNTITIGPWVPNITWTADMATGNAVIPTDWDTITDTTTW